MSSDSVVQGAIVKTISELSCSEFFMGHLGVSQRKQQKIVKPFQKYVSTRLMEEVPLVQWSQEFQPINNLRDSIDIFGATASLSIVIEIDKPRADQVSKKFVSRSAMISDGRMLYIALCYPGTRAMSVGECKKYFGYCSALSRRMNNSFAGFLIE